MDYKKTIRELSERIPKNIVDFGTPRVRRNVPTQAFSDFLTHVEQGDWAEKLFFNALSNGNFSFIPVKYGKADKIIAGDPNFKEFYKSYQDELDAIGKRPDILIFRKEDYQKEWGNDISQFSEKELNNIVPKAICGFEVRSSAYLTRKFIPKNDRPFLSFTPKVEDLLVVLKWIETFGVPHYYVQVFFDAIYIIPFKDILLLLNEANFTESGNKNKKMFGRVDGKPAFVIEKNPKNQYKETIHIYLDRGHVICKKIEPPKLLGIEKELVGGRLLHYVNFEGGKAEINKEELLKLIDNIF